MSLLNAYVSTERAIVCVDTRVMATGTFLAAEIYGSASKLLPLPHAGVVLAARGSIEWIGIVFAGLNLAMIEGFDDACEAVKHVIASEQSIYAAICEARGLLSSADMEAVLVGYSERQGQLAGMYWKGTDINGFIQPTMLDSWVLAPSADDNEVPLDPNSGDRMAAYARRQIARLHSEHPGDAFGGRLIMAEVTRTGIDIRTIANLDDSLMPQVSATAGKAVL